MPLDTTAIDNTGTVDPSAVFARSKQPAAPATDETSEQLLKSAQAAMDKYQEAQPKPQSTPPEQEWGSMAMALAAVGGLLTHTPATTGLNAMAGVLNAYKSNDAAEAQKQFDQWKVSHETTGKLVDYMMKLYEEANKANSPQARLAAIRAVDAQFKVDEDKAFLAQAGGDPIEAAKLRVQALRKSKSAGDAAAGEFEGIHAEKVAIGEVADGLIAQKQQELGRPLTKAEKAQVYLDAEAAHDAAKAGATSGARAAANPANQPLDQDSLRDATAEFRTTGKMPALGMGSSVIRKQILEERSRELREESGSVATDITRQSDVHSLQQALTILERSHANVANFEGTALKEADLVEEKARAGAAVGGVPMINRWVQAGRTSIAGDGDVSAFNAAVTSFKNEYARIMSSPTATGGQTSDAARAEADTLINAAMTKGQLTDVIDTMKRGMQNRIDSINEELQATQSSIASLGSEVGRGARQPAAAPHPVIPSTLAGKPGLQWSASRQQWRDGTGTVYDAAGQQVK